MAANINKEEKTDTFFPLLLGEHTIPCEGVLLKQTRISLSLEMESAIDKKYRGKRNMFRRDITRGT